MTKSLLQAGLVLALLTGCTISPKTKPIDIPQADVPAKVAVVSPAQYNFFALTQFDGDVPPGFKRRFRFYEGTTRPEEKRGVAPEIYEMLQDDFFVQQAGTILARQGYEVVTPDQADYFLVYSDLGFTKTPAYTMGYGLATMPVIVWTLGILPPYCDEFVFTVQHSVYAADDLGNALEAEQNVHVMRACLNAWAHGMFPSAASKDEIETVYTHLVEQSVKSLQVNYVLY